MRAGRLVLGPPGQDRRTSTGSGIAIMSDSSIGLKPVIDDPSKPMPPSNASSSSSRLIEKLFSWPRMSVNQRRMKRTSRSSQIAATSCGVVGALSANGGSFWFGFAGARGRRRARNPRRAESNRVAHCGARRVDLGRRARIRSAVGMRSSLDGTSWRSSREDSQHPPADLLHLRRTSRPAARAAPDPAETAAGPYARRPEPLARPAAQRGDRRLERLALGRQLVLDPHRRRRPTPGGRRCRSTRAPCRRIDSSRSEICGIACEISENRIGPGSSDVHDRAGPALAEQLDRLVVVRADVAGRDERRRGVEWIRGARCVLGRGGCGLRRRAVRSVGAGPRIGR